MIDLHTHTILSDGMLIPSELVRRAVVNGVKTIALTDHVDHSNIESVIPALVKVSEELNKYWDIIVLPGVELTHIPGTAEYLLGIINMGGMVIPVADIRKRFNLPDREMNLDDRIIISLISRRKIAFIVDNVQGIVEFSREQVDEVHQIFPEMEHYIEGVGRFGDNTVLIITVEKLFSIQNMNRLDKVIKGQESN